MSEWQTLPTVLKAAKDILVEKPMNVINFVSVEPVMKAGKSAGLMGILGGEYGIRSVSEDYKFGFSSSVFSIGNNQILYLCRKDKGDYYPDCSTFLPTLKKLELTASIDGYIYPKVGVLGDKDWSEEKKCDTAVSLFKKTLEEGHFFYDISYDNIGLLKNNTPILIDRDSFAKVKTDAIDDNSHSLFLKVLSSNDKLRDAFNYPMLDKMIDIENYTPSPTLIRSMMRDFFTHVQTNLKTTEYDFKASVEGHLKETDVEVGKIKGVFDSKFILQLRDEVEKLGIKFRDTKVYDLLVRKGYNSEAIHENTGIKLTENSISEMMEKMNVRELK